MLIVIVKNSYDDDDDDDDRSPKQLASSSHPKHKIRSQLIRKDMEQKCLKTQIPAKTNKPPTPKK